MVRIAATPADLAFGNTHAQLAQIVDQTSAAVFIKDLAGRLVFANPAFESITGQGVRGRVAGRAVAIGNQRLLESLEVDPGVLAQRAERLRAEGETVMFVAVDGRPAGLVGVADPIKQTTPGALQALRAEGLRIVMLTGDSRTTAEAVARKVGIEEIQAEVLPEHKNEVVRRLREEGAVVAMAGDGINDAPALATADLGIAIGTGTDVAIAASDITLVGGSLRGIVSAVALSRRTVTTIKQGLAWAFAYNVLLIPVAAGVLYGWHHLLLDPVLASAAMAMSSVSVVTNALRLRRFSTPATAQEITRRPLRARVADSAYLVAVATVALALGAG